MKRRYRIFGTTADLGVASRGTCLKEAFEGQAAGMFAAMADLRRVRRKYRYGVEARGGDDERLLVSFLEELLFLFDTKQTLVREVSIVSIKGGVLKAVALGETYDPSRHIMRTPIKAVTHHGLTVEKGPGGVSTTVIYDI